MQFAIAPTAWPADHPWEALLDAVADAGFAGVTLDGDRFPEDPAVLGPALAARGLAVAAGTYRPGLIEGQGVATALNHVNALLDRLVALGCGCLVVAEPVVPERGRMAGRVAQLGGRPLGEDQWQNLADGLDELGARCQARGLALALAPHAGTYLETPVEIKKALNMTDASLVGLALDPGQIAYGGGDPTDLLETYMRRVRHVHLRDLDRRAHDAAMRAGLGYADALGRGVFPVAGRGGLPLATILARLAEGGYTGWVVADPPAGEPVATIAKASRAALAALASPA